MSVPIHIVGGLPYVAVTLRANEQMLTLQQVLIDTGSSGSVFKTDDLKKLGVRVLLTDRLHFLRGIGGEEAVVEKTIDALEVGSLVVAPFRIEMGAVDYGVPMDGILGLNFLLRAQAVIDLNALQLRPADNERSS
jgi:hypothetical protein